MPGAIVVSIRSRASAVGYLSCEMPGAVAGSKGLSRDMQRPTSFEGPQLCCSVGPVCCFPRLEMPMFHPVNDQTFLRCALYVGMVQAAW